jgi:Domain of unknown function (DUF4263)
MDPILIDPTSKDSAVCEPVVLRLTDTRRLVFKPELVNSVHDKRQAVKGRFIYQRKKKADEWEDVDSISLSHLKSGEGYQLAIDTEEVFKLVEALNTLYTLHGASGIPKKATVAFPADQTVADSLTADKLDALGQALQKVGPDDLKRIIGWIVKTENTAKAIQHLERLDVHSLQKLTTIIGISSLKNALALWEKNKTNSDEEFWQKKLEENAFVLSQVFSSPIVILKGKAYVGGKGIENTGGNVLDYLCANELTRNTLLIEIKTPLTPLLGSLYRGDVHNVSTELAGAMMQVSNSKDALLKNCHTLKADSASKFEAFNPPCVVIAGNTGELTDSLRLKSFELFRNGLKDVSIIAYDELFAKIRHIVDLLEGKGKE